MTAFAFELILCCPDFWEASGAAQTIVDAFKELSRRVVERKGKKIIIKLSPSFVIKLHRHSR